MTMINREMSVYENGEVHVLVATEHDIDNVLKENFAEAEFIAAQRYSDIEKLKFAKIIREFNALYYQLSAQTWGNTRWRNVAVCKAPTDLWIYQELITRLRPDLVIETGSHTGGSALFLRDMLRLVCDGAGWVISIDVDVSKLQPITQVDGVKFLKASSIEFEAVAFVKAHIAAYGCKRVMVILDSDHAQTHVAKELELYAPLVTVGSALIVEDTSNHEGARAAAEEWYIEQPDRYEFRKDFMCEKFMLTFNRDGYFERVK